MTKVYIMGGLGAAVLIMLIYSTVRYSLTVKDSQKEKGVCIKHRSKKLLNTLGFCIAWLFITGANVLLAQDNINTSYYSEARKANEETRKLFYGVTFVLYVIIFTATLVKYLTFKEFKLCETCFYDCGVKRSKEKYSYSLEGRTLTLCAPRMKDITVDIPEEKLSEVASILERCYTRRE